MQQASTTQPNHSVDLFGDPIQVVEQKLSLKEDNFIEPLHGAEEYFLRKNIPDELLNYMHYAFGQHCLRRDVGWVPTREESQGDLLGERHMKLNFSTHVFENLMWLFDLYDSPSAFSFDAVCVEAGEDAEMIRNVVARNMSIEIKNLVRFVSTLDQDYAERIAKKVEDYVSVREMLH